MAQAGTLEVIITASTQGLVAGIANARDAINKAGPDLKRYAAIITGTVVAGLTASVYAFGQAQKSATSLAHALANQGITSRKVLEDLLAYSTELQHLSGVSDEAISDSQALLVAFGMQGKTLRDTTKAALDLSVAKNIDLAAASNLLGKAFAGETSSLKRYGIIVDESIPAAQRFAEVLRQINANFGGRAAAQGKTFFGMLNIAKEDVSDFAEAIGAQLVPTVQRFVQFMIDNRTVLMKAADDVGSGIRKWIDDFAAVLDWLRVNKHIIKDALFGAGLGALLGVPGGIPGMLAGGLLGGSVGGFLGSMGKDGEVGGSIIQPATRVSTKPADLVPAGIGASKGGGGAKNEINNSEVFKNGWNNAITEIGAQLDIWGNATRTLFAGITSTLSQGFQDAFSSMADGATNMMEVLGKMGTAFKNLMFKIVADIMAQWITAQILQMAMTRQRQTSEIMGAAQVAAANNVAAMASIPFGWIIGLAGAGAIIAAVMSFAKFAEGGIVNGPTLGLVGEAGPEAIIPLSKGKEMGLLGGGGGGQPIVIQISGEFLEADAGRWDDLVRRHIIPALGAYQDKTRTGSFNNRSGSRRG